MTLGSHQGGETVLFCLLPFLILELPFSSSPQVGERQLRHFYDGFVVTGAFRIDGPDAATAQQRFVDDEPYRAARRGVLMVDKLVSRRKFSTWGMWAQDCLRVSPLGAPVSFCPFVSIICLGFIHISQLTALLWVAMNAGCYGHALL